MEIQGNEVISVSFWLHVQNNTMYIPYDCGGAGIVRISLYSCIPICHVHEYVMSQGICFVNSYIDNFTDFCFLNSQMLHGLCTLHTY